MVHDYEYEDQGHGETVIVMGGRRTTKHHPFHVSMHVEDEFGSCLRQRISANTTLSSRQSEENDLSTGKYLTPDSRRLDDSGFPQSPDVGSDPDWYLRPRRLLTSESRRYIKYDTRKSSNSDILVRRVKSLFGLGRPNYMYHGGSQWFLHTEAILGAIIFIIVVASLGFSALISARFFESNQGSIELNGKYKSLQFAKDQQVDVLTPRIESTMEHSTDTRVKGPSHIPRDVNEVKGVVLQSSKVEVNGRQIREIPVEIDPVEPLPNDGSKLDEASKPIVLKVEAVKDNVKRNQRTKNRNPLTKSVKKSKITKVKEPKTTNIKENTAEEKNFDYDGPAFRGINNDYDDPSTFRGKNKDFDVLDLLETDLSKELTN